jgi:hypothetical protein
MASSWLDIIDRSSDPNLGAALVRLARMAAALHQGEQLDAADSQSTPPADHAHADADRRQPPVYMEVNR